MGKDVPFEKSAKCDECGKIGAYDFMGDLFCPECAEKIIEPEPDCDSANAGVERPNPCTPLDAMRLITTAKKFVTIEPVLDFDVDILAAMIHTINPFFVNLGADSKGRGLAEPTVEKIMRLVDRLSGYGIELREKHNLKRLKP